MNKVKKKCVFLITIFLAFAILFYQIFYGYLFLFFYTRSDGGNWFVRAYADQIDPWTFRVTKKPRPLSFNFINAQDKDSIWLNYGGDIGPISLHGLDTKTFEFINGTQCYDCYAKDKNHVFYIMDRIFNKKLDETHPGTLFPQYVAENNNAFIIESADIETFKDLGDGFGEDKVRTYYRGIPVE